MSKILKFIENRIKSIKILHIRWIYKRTIPLWMIIFALIIISSSIALFVLLGIDFFEKNNDSTFFIGILSAGLIFFFGTIIYLIRYHQIEKHRKEEHKESDLANSLKNVNLKIDENKKLIVETKKYPNKMFKLKVNLSKLENLRFYLIEPKSNSEEYWLNDEIEKIKKEDHILFIWRKNKSKKNWYLINPKFYNKMENLIFKNMQKLELEKYPAPKEDFDFFILENLKLKQILLIFYCKNEFYFDDFDDLNIYYLFKNKSFS